MGFPHAEPAGSALAPAQQPAPARPLRENGSPNSPNCSTSGASSERQAALPQTSAELPAPASPRGAAAPRTLAGQPPPSAPSGLPLAELKELPPLPPPEELRAAAARFEAQQGAAFAAAGLDSAAGAPLAPGLDAGAANAVRRSKRSAAAAAAGRWAPAARRLRLEDAADGPRFAAVEAAAEGRRVVETETPSDAVDDGFRWYKRGQAVPKGNLHPRSYYKCADPGCGARKQVERSGRDARMLVTTYEGVHTHEAPPPLDAAARAAARMAPANDARVAKATGGRIKRWDQREELDAAARRALTAPARAALATKVAGLDADGRAALTAAANDANVAKVTGGRVASWDRLEELDDDERRALTAAPRAAGDAQRGEVLADLGERLLPFAELVAAKQDLRYPGGARGAASAAFHFGTDTACRFNVVRLLKPLARLVELELHLHPEAPTRREDESPHDFRVRIGGGVNRWRGTTLALEAPLHRAVRLAPARLRSVLLAMLEGRSTYKPRLPVPGFGPVACPGTPGGSGWLVRVAVAAIFAVHRGNLRAALRFVEAMEEAAFGARAAVAAFREARGAVVADVRALVQEAPEAPPAAPPAGSAWFGGAARGDRLDRARARMQAILRVLMAAPRPAGRAKPAGSGRKSARRS